MLRWEQLKVSQQYLIEWVYKMASGEVPTKMADKKIGGFDEWEVKNAARTLMEAIEIRKKPKLFAVAKKEADKIAKLAVAAALEKKVNAKLLKTFGNPGYHGKKK